MSTDSPSDIPGAASPAAGMPQDDRDSGLSVLAAAGISALVSLVIVVSALIVYDRVLRPVRGVATIDIDLLVQAKEALVTDELNRLGATGSPGRAYELAGSFTRDLTAAIENTQRDCTCDIFVRAAVVSAPSIDLTQAVATRLGLRSDDVRSARDRVRGAIRSAAPNFPTTASGAPK
jgi:hypothetical protein